MKNTTNVSAVDASGIEVYWNKDCSSIVSSIEWGNIKLGSTRSVVIYVRNGSTKAIYLSLFTKNWNPSTASGCILLLWNYSEKQINPEDIIPIKLTLSASRYAKGISKLKFDILLVASNYLLGDVNDDGIIDYRDLFIFAVAYGSKPGDSNWNPDYDFNIDNEIGYLDLNIMVRNYTR